MMPRSSLDDIEQIKILKSRYFYCLDHKDWDGWRNRIFVADCRMDVSEAAAEPIIGIEKVIQLARGVLEKAVSVHHGHMPDIELTSEDTATGIWAMEDLISFPKGSLYQGKYASLHGYGHYHETYVRTSAGWRIKTLRLDRLRLELS